MWIKCYKNEERFREIYGNWLQERLTLPKSLLREERNSKKRKSFDDLSEGHKYVRVREVAKAQLEDTPLLLRATSSTMSSRQEPAKAKILKEMTESPQRAVKMLRRLKTGEEAEKATKFTTQEALALLYELGLSEDKYEILRKKLGAKGQKGLLPPIQRLREEKQNLRPLDTIDSMDFSADVSLQCLLEHTAMRLVCLQEEVIRGDFIATGKAVIDARLVFNAEMDGTTGQSQYHHKPSQDFEVDYDDRSLFVCYVIPLLLRRTEAHLTPYWLNNKPQSSALCRPLRMKFEKESKELVGREKRQLDKEINELESIQIPFDDGMTLNIHFDVNVKGVDGKIMCFFTDTSTQCCQLCYARPSIMNKIVDGKVPAPPIILENLKYAGQTLHSYIQFLRHCLNLAYRVTLPKPKRKIKKGSSDYYLKEMRKKSIQKMINCEFGIWIDVPRPGGAGNSCTGNVARRLFGAYQQFAQICGLDVQLIQNYNTILKALNCKLPLDAEKFGLLCKTTAELYVKKYDWYYMPPTVHRILMHGPAIIRQNALPIAFFGEEGGESCNKLYREIRRYHTRKISRRATMRDLFYRCLEMSDPIISSLRNNSVVRRRKRNALASEVRELLLPCLSDNEPRELFPDTFTEEDFLEIYDFDIPFDEEIEIETTQDELDDEIRWQSIFTNELDPDHYDADPAMYGSRAMFDCLGNIDPGYLAVTYGP